MFNLFGNNPASASAKDSIMNHGLSLGINTPATQMMNGRVDFTTQAKPYSMNADSSVQNIKSEFSKEALRGELVSNPLSDVFFSDVNFNALHGAIRYRVYIDSNKTHKISRQSDTELQIIMRSTYYQYAKNLSFDITGQVKVLNKKVLDFVVPRIIQEINQYYQYKKDASSLPVPLQRSESVSNAGNKFLFRGEF